MSEIVSFYDWYLSQRTKPKGKVLVDTDPKDIEEETIYLVKEKNIKD